MTEPPADPRLPDVAHTRMHDLPRETTLGDRYPWGGGKGEPFGFEGNLEQQE